MHRTQILDTMLCALSQLCQGQIIEHENEQCVLTAMSKLLLYELRTLRHISADVYDKLRSKQSTLRGKRSAVYQEFSIGL
jgi:hypothetical protein